MSNLDTIFTTYLGTSKSDNKPEKHQYRLHQIYDLLSNPRISTTKNGEYIITVSLGKSGIRNEKNVEKVGGYFLDFDKGVDEFTIQKKLKGFEFLAHTTFSHTAEAPHWRVFIPYNKEYPAAIHKTVYAYMVSHFDTFEIDSRCKTASQLWFLPTAKSISDFRVIYKEGILLDPTKLKVASTTAKVVKKEKISTGLYVTVGLRDQWFFDEALKYRVDGRIEGEAIAGLEYVRTNNTEQPLGNEFTYEDLIQKVKSAYRGEYEIDSKAASERVAGIVLPTTFEAVTGAKLARKRFKKVRWLVDSILPEGVTILAARPKTGKTRLALNLAIAVASGKKAFSHYDVEHSEVLFLAADERSERLMAHRLKEMKLGSPKWLHIVTEGIPLLGEGFEEHLNEWMRLRENTGLIVVDTWGRIKPSKRAGADSYEHDGEYLSKLQGLCRKYGNSTLILHHTKKGGGVETGEESILGSTALSGGVDTILMLNRTLYSDNCMELTRTSRYDFGVRLTLESVRDGGSWKYLGETGDQRVTEEKKEIWDVLGQSQHPMSVSELVDITGKSRSALSKQLYRMEANGEVRSERKGRTKLYLHGYTKT